VASQFSALPLGKGEAFLLLTQHDDREWAILVDSGNLKAEKLVAKIDEVAPSLQKIDIAICTHQDKDHASGFKRLADVWCANGRAIGEFWLPGRWAAAFPEILLDPVATAERLLLGAYEVAEKMATTEPKGESRETHETRIRQIAEEMKIGAAFKEASSDDENISEVRNISLVQSLGLKGEELQNLSAAFEESDHAPFEVLRNLEKTLEWLHHPYLWRARDMRHGVLAMSLFLEAIETAKIITAIAESAVRRNIPIRWFDFGLFETSKVAKGGIRGFLEPLSSVELRRPPKRVSDSGLLLLFALSKQNVESLVFYRVETSAEPAVLFIGDSRLSFGLNNPNSTFPLPILIPSRQFLATAPHHGSQVNDIVYSIIDNLNIETPLLPIYIRNGRHHKIVIKQFLQQPHRCCAQCRHCGSKRLSRNITLNSSNGMWCWPTCQVPKCQ
jgi:hypothetical protein